MKPFHIGAMLESFRLPIPEALKTAAGLGVEGIQVYATRGEMSPHNLVGQKRKDFLKMVKDNGLIISALCGDLGHGFFRPEEIPHLIEESKLILDLAKELETNVVTTHIGVVRWTRTSPWKPALRPAPCWATSWTVSIPPAWASTWTPPTWSW